MSLALLAALVGATAAGGAPVPPRPSALIVFLSSPPTGVSSPRAPSGPNAAVAGELASEPSLSVGLLSATEGVYRAEQLLLDIGQGARVQYDSYRPHVPPPLSLSMRAGGASLAGWDAVLRRARGAPQILDPGLLASSIPGGAGYAGVEGQSTRDAIAAADRDGRIRALSIGAPRSLAARAERLSQHQRLVVADLPGQADASAAALTYLIARRPADQLLFVLERAPDRPGHELLWVGLDGAGGRRELTSATTSQAGLVAATDLAPSVLAHLDLPLPSAMRGTVIHTDGPLALSRLRSFAARLAVLGSRRMPTLLTMALVLIALVAVASASGHGAAALRVSALAVLWTPVTVLAGAAVEPGAVSERALIILASLALGALTERLTPWPRGPIAPALAAMAVLTFDALAGTQLLVRSLLGPNPIFGARFYGIGNELKSALAVLVFAAVAAALTPAGYPEPPPRSRRAAASMAGAGVVLAVVEGSARLGAGVGGVILVAAGTAVAVLMLLPGRFTPRRVLTVAVSPALGLAVLAVLDLATAHGGGHFTGSVLHARSSTDIRDLIVRRYSDAVAASVHGLMPEATILALLVVAGALRWRERLYAAVPGAPWPAALAGGLTAAVVGALAEDSGTLLLVVGVFTLGWITAYVGAPPPEAPSGTHARAPRPGGVAGAVNGGASLRGGRPGTGSPSHRA